MVFVIFHLLHDNLKMYKLLTSNRKCRFLKCHSPFSETPFSVLRNAVHHSLNLMVNKHRNNGALLCMLINYSLICRREPCSSVPVLRTACPLHPKLYVMTCSFDKVEFMVHIATDILRPVLLLFSRAGIEWRGGMAPRLH